MVFSSLTFIFIFLPIFFLFYYLLPYRFKNLCIVLFSILFYAWGAPKFIFILIGSILADFILAHGINRAKTEKARLVWLLCSIVSSLSLLFYFKYSNFFIDNLNVLLRGFGINAIAWSKYLLPLGISFFTFHQLSYLIDVYRKVKAPMTNILDYALYVLLFPQLVAGPIIRFNEISDSIIDRRDSINMDNFLLGFFRFTIGLSKKILIANQAAIICDDYFNINPYLLGTIDAWIGLIAYTIQIYYDFSGYSDMAIGLAKMMGFQFPENFNAPYIAKNITEFWQRWHISLSRWMKDYIYIPLGGNKVSKFRNYINLVLVFIISGFWHGAAWNFLFWGLFHGVFLLLDKLFWIKVSKKIPGILNTILTLYIVMHGWLLFRANDLRHAINYLKAMYYVSDGQFTFVTNKIALPFIIGILLVLISNFKFINTIYNDVIGLNWKKMHYWLFFLILPLFIFSVSALVANGFNPFIYFRF